MNENIYIRDDGKPTYYTFVWTLHPKWWYRIWCWLRGRSPMVPFYTGAVNLPTIKIDRYIELWSVPDPRG